LERSDKIRPHFISSEPGLRGELPATSAEMVIPGDVLSSGLERSDKKMLKASRLRLAL
jgi:hypothetical protein